VTAVLLVAGVLIGRLLCGAADNLGGEAALVAPVEEA
jgi:hypothetical protein